LIVGTDGGVWSTTDFGESWQNHNATLPTLMFYSAALHPSDPGFTLGGFRDFPASVQRNDSQTWQYLPALAPVLWGEAEVAISTSRPDTHWMVGNNPDLVWRTTDGGRSGTRVDGGIDHNGASAFVAPVRKCPRDDNVFLAGTNRIWRTNDFFSSAMPSWIAQTPARPFPTPGFTGLNDPGTILSIAYLAADTRCHTYAYGNRGGQVRLTQSGGATWIDPDPQRALPPRPITALVFDPTNANTLYVGLSSFDVATPGRLGHVFKTMNALGATPVWSNISPPADAPFNVIAVDPRNPQRVYAGSDRGLWHSDDGGGSWVKDGLDVGLPNVSVYDIQINPATDSTVVFTYGRGAYRLVTVASSPRPPTDLRVVAVVGNDVTMSFNAPSDGLVPARYVLEGGTTPGQVLASLPIAAGETALTFPAPTGAFYVRVHTLAGGLRVPRRTKCGSS
jgi:photosystem II stability/assembly factor-like uncharacterized protein